MSSWSRLNNTVSKAVEFFWRGQKVGELTSTLTRFIELSLPEVDDKEEAEEAFCRLSIESGYQWCLSRLAAQNQSKKQLFQKLRQRGLCKERIEPILQKLEKSGYLDEESLSQLMQQKALRARKSRRFVEQSLKSKGLKINQLDWESSKNQDVENAFFWLKKWGEKEDLRQKTARYMSRLASRGFDFDVCQLAWQRWLREFTCGNSK